MKKLLTLTIAIPAYNEEANIANLLHDVIQQKIESVQLKEIVVALDGCTDGTEEKVASLKNSKISCISNKKREGLAVRLNQLCKYAQTDVLVILNADTRFNDEHFIDLLIQPIIKGGTDLTSARIRELPPKSFFEQVLFIGMNMKQAIVKAVKNGNSVYTCCGLARGFSKKLYSTIVFETSVGDDAFSYFFALTNNFAYKFVNKACIYYKLASSFNEHQKQTIRFFQSRSIMEKRFGKNIVGKNYKIPTSGIIKGLVKSLWDNPLHTTLYALIVFYIQLKNSIKPTYINVQKWEIATSSKKLHI